MKKTPLLILGVTAVLFSRALFVFFNDSEGPNVPVVLGMTLVVYFLSLAAYLFIPLPSLFTGTKKILAVILIQILIVTGLYFLLL